MTFGELFVFEKVGSFKVTPGRVHKPLGGAYSRGVWFPGVCSSWGVYSPGVCSFLGVNPRSMLLLGVKSLQYAPPGESDSPGGAYSRQIDSPGGAYSQQVDSPGVCSSRGVKFSNLHSAHGFEKFGWFLVGAYSPGVWFPVGAHSWGVSSNLNNLEDLKVNLGGELGSWGGSNEPKNKGRKSRVSVPIKVQKIEFLICEWTKLFDFWKAVSKWTQLKKLNLALKLCYKITRSKMEKIAIFCKKITIFFKCCFCKNSKTEWDLLKIQKTLNSLKSLAFIVVKMV